MKDRQTARSRERQTDRQRQRETERQLDQEIESGGGEGGGGYIGKYREWRENRDCERESQKQRQNAEVRYSDWQTDSSKTRRKD